MKKIITLILSVLMAFGCLAGLTACNKNDNFVANAATDVEGEEYGFIISKNASKKTEILAAMNKVIAETDINKAIDYFTAVEKGETPTVSLNFPNLADNTAGELKVYTESGFVPYEFVGDDGKVTGVDMYLMQLVCEELNMTLNITDMGFDGICGKVALEDNAVGAAGITINDERKLTLDFSNPYVSSVQYIVSAKDQNYTKISDLAGKTIGVQKGTTGYFMVSKAIEEGALKGTGATVIQYDSLPVAYTALKANKVEIVVGDKLPILSLVD